MPSRQPLSLLQNDTFELSQSDKNQQDTIFNS